MASTAVWIRQHAPKLIHPRFRSYVLRHLDLRDKRTEWWRSKDPYLHDPPYSTYESRYPVKLGIIREFWHRHWPYISACRDLRVGYELIDILGPQWLSVAGQSQCDAFLVWPSVQISAWKQMYDERLKIMVEELGKVIYPTYDELWLYESKRRMYYWLEANNIPCPKTHIFYARTEARDFAQTCALPIVAKTDAGARASGVRILRSRRGLAHYVEQCFGKGIIHDDGDAHDRHQGCVLLQEYLPNAAEWRMLRLGRSYFGHQKLKKGDFHSGSGEVGWYDPPTALLDFAYEVTETGGFTSMDLDIFETPDGRYRVNELQSLFGSYRPYQMLVRGKPGRYVRDPETGAWEFEEGIFCRNSSCDLRVQALLEKLMGAPVPQPTGAYAASFHP